MMHDVPWKVMVSYAAFKGTVVAVFTAIVGTLFWQSIAVAIVSGSLGMIGMMGAAWITVRATEKRVKRIDVSIADVKGKLDAAKRREDKRDEDA